MNHKHLKTLYKRIYTVVLIVLCTLSVCGCTTQTQPVTYTDYYFDTVVSLTFYQNDGAKLAEECFQLCETYENLLSRTMEGSDIWRINHSNGSPVIVSAETYELIKEALFYCELTQGKIDITIAPLIDLWKFTDNTEEHIPPSHEDITALLAHVDYTQVVLGDNNTVTLQDPEAAIDLGFIAKGFIADQIKEYLTSQGVTSSIINLGGNICTIGNKPDGSTYTVGIQEPFAPAGTTIDTFTLSNSCAVTSGTYERYFTYNDTVYHHIIDATTGYPADNGLTSVTILCDSATEADALSTTCFVLGADEALTQIRSMTDTECILIDEEGTIYES